MYTKALLAISAFFLPSAFASPIEARQCVGPNVNAATVALIKEFEGFVPKPAPDPIGLPTVGYGHLCQTSGCSEVPYSFPLTEATATQLLMSDLKVNGSGRRYLVQSLFPSQSPQQTITLRTKTAVTLNANQYGALVSWAFNVGNGNVQSSTLLSRLNAGEDEATVIAEELPKWRRAAEVALAQTATSVGALPVGC
jgi:GH24 family phage-related lysozyme (muramidase)